LLIGILQDLKDKFSHNKTQRDKAFDYAWLTCAIISFVETSHDPPHTERTGYIMCHV